MDLRIGDVVKMLNLSTIDDHQYRGSQPPVPGRRVFGGQVCAQALMAAGRTVKEKRPASSFHAYFLRQADPSAPIDYTVEVLRDGRNYSHRRVTASQSGHVLLDALTAFCEPSSGVDYQDDMPPAAYPEDLPPINVRLRPYADELDGWWVRSRPFDIRYVNVPPRVAADQPSGTHPPVNQLWMRADGDIPVDRLLHDCLILYASDLNLLDPILLHTGRVVSTGTNSGIASVNHTMWFHRPADPSSWMFYDQTSASAVGRRGFAQGKLFDREGRLVATMSQEGYFISKT